jgi:putative transposase
LSYRQVEELMQERGVSVNHATINRCPEIQSPAGTSLPSPQAPGEDELADGQTFIKVKGQWRYFYRAVDKHGQTIDFSADGAAR